MGEVFDLIAVDGGLAVNQYRQNTLVFTNLLGRVASYTDKWMRIIGLRQESPVTTT